MTHADLLLYAAQLKVERDALLEALKAMVASYDGIRDALTCQTVIAKLKRADDAIARVEAPDHAACTCGNGWTFDFQQRRVYCRTCEATSHV